MNDEVVVERLLLPDTSNGGFPEPPPDRPVRVVTAVHLACGERTRVRLPEIIPTHAIRRLRCAHCKQEFDAHLIDEVDAEPAAPEVAPEPEPVVAEPEPVATPEPEPVVVAEPEPVVVAEPEPTFLKEPEPASEPTPTGDGTSSAPFTLPPFEMPVFEELKFPSAEEIEVERVAEPAPQAHNPPEIAEEIEELLEGELEDVPEVQVVDDEPEDAELAAPEVEPAVTALPSLLRDARPVGWETPPPPARRRSPRMSEVRLPKLRSPQVRLPQIKLPRLRMPKPPAVALPKPKAPRIRRPAFALPRSPEVRLPRLPELRLPTIDSGSEVWRIGSVVIAVIAVILVFNAIQGGNPRLTPAVTAPATPATDARAPATDDPVAAPATGADSDGAPGSGRPSGDTHLVRGTTYSLALPAGWERVETEGAAFAAASGDGGADAQLWISDDPKLDFPTFINNSLAQLEALAGSAQIVERVPGPTPETTIVRLAADAPPGQPTYEVTLRAAGPYFYYLATSVEPDASPEAAEGADLIAGSLTPEVGN